MLVELLPSLVHGQRLPQLRELAGAVVLGGMGSTIHRLKIGWTVVGRVVVLVSSNLRRREAAAELAGEDGAMEIGGSITHG